MVLWNYTCIAECNACNLHVEALLPAAARAPSGALSPFNPSRYCKAVLGSGDKSALLPAGTIRGLMPFQG